jgi:hypothetical protein
MTYRLSLAGGGSFAGVLACMGVAFANDGLPVPSLGSLTAAIVGLVACAVAAARSSP